VHSRATHRLGNMPDRNSHINAIQLFRSTNNEQTSCQSRRDFDRYDSGEEFFQHLEHCENGSTGISALMSRCVRTRPECSPGPGALRKASIGTGSHCVLHALKFCSQPIFFPASAPGSRREVDQQVVQVAPEHVAPELLNLLADQRFPPSLLNFPRLTAFSGSQLLSACVQCA
jgi:hypothetical protein